MSVFFQFKISEKKTRRDFPYPRPERTVVACQCIVRPSAAEHPLLLSGKYARSKTQKRGVSIGQLLSHPQYLCLTIYISLYRKIDK